MNARVLIIGSGPSAAFAVLACQDAGADFHVMSSTPAMMDQAGAFFIHWVPERLKAWPARVQIWGTGTREGYLMKQWGEAGAGVYTSFPREQHIEDWYNSNVLDKAWATVPVQLTIPVTDQFLALYGTQYDVVFHTFSAKRTAERRKLVRFPTLTHVAVHPQDYGNNLIVYNGELDQEHIRTTVAFNRMSVEFPAGTRPESLKDYRRGFKGRPELVYLRDIPPGTAPVGPDEYVSPNVVPLGRFATWDRHALSHHSYAAVRKVLDGVTA